MNWLKNVLFPASKLQANFPWNVTTAGQHYFAALLYFVLGSIIVPLAVMAPIWGLALYPDILKLMLEDHGVLKLIFGSVTVGALTTAGVMYVFARMKHRALDFTWKMRLAIYPVIGGLIVCCGFFLLVDFVHPRFPELIQWVASVVSTGDGKPNMTFVMGISLLSFVCGFGMQVWYINRALAKDGHSLTGAMGLNLNGVRGKTPLHTAWNMIFPVAVCYGLFQLIGYTVISLLGEVHQPTVDMARQATGGNFLMFALMAAVGAPLFEEVVFRGFLFQIIRSSLRREPEPLKDDASSWTRFWFNFNATVRSIFGGNRLELSAIIISSFLFALLHLQFNPTTFVLLFLLGCVHAELYRRTGSLWCSIMLHAVNNGIEVIKLGMGG